MIQEQDKQNNNAIDFKKFESNGNRHKRFETEKLKRNQTSRRQQLRRIKI